MIDKLEIPTQSNPPSEPAWRWNTVKKLINSKRKKSVDWQHDDPLVAKLVSDHHRNGRLRDAKTIAALQIYEADGLARAEIESRVLGDQGDEEIADSCGLPFDLVRLYVVLFFDVRRFQTRMGWLLEQTVGRKPEIGFKDHQVRELWCGGVLWHGTSHLEALISVFKNCESSDHSFLISHYLDAETEATEALKVAIAMRVIPSTGIGAAWHVEFSSRLSMGISATLKSTKEQQQFIDLVIQLAKKHLAGKRLPKPEGLKRFERERRQYYAQQRSRSR